MSAHLVPAVRDLFERHPRAARLSPEQVAGLLWILRYAPDSEAGGPPDPFEVAGACEVLDIERRSRQNGQERPEEEMYAASVRRYHSRRRKEIAALWFAHFCRMSENHARISEDYQRRAEELCEEGRQQ